MPVGGMVELGVEALEAVEGQVRDSQRVSTADERTKLWEKKGCDFGISKEEKETMI